MRVGNYIVPTFRLKSLVRHLEDIYRVYPNNEVTKEQLAQAMRLVVNSGGFAQKISDLKVYGLLSVSGGKYVISELGKQIAQTHNPVKIEQAFKNVELWKILIEKYDTNLDKLTISTEILRIAGLSPDTANEKSDLFYTAYLDDFQYMMRSYSMENPPTDTNTHNELPSVRQNIQQSTLPIPSSTGQEKTRIFITPIKGYRISSEYGNFQIEIRDEFTLKLAKAALSELLDAIKKELETKGVIFSTDLDTKVVPKM